MKRNKLFLPRLIDVWGGIENYLSQNRQHMYLGKCSPVMHYVSNVQMICALLGARLARSGKFPVEAANELLWKACLRYSGAPSRSFERARLRGTGVVVLNRWGDAEASLCYIEVRDKWRDEAEKAEANHIPFVWTDSPERCRFCGAPVEKYRFKKTHHDYFCARPECRHMAWLADRPQSRGGIDLTPTQRKTTARTLWDQVRVLNYLNAKAKQARRKSNVRTQAS